MPFANDIKPGDLDEDAAAAARFAINTTLLTHLRPALAPAPRPEALA